jgi:ATP-binding cassette subfamily B protein
MKKSEKKARLPFFGIGKILPYLKNYKKALTVMLIGSLVGSIIDISVPLFQRYALNHFISGGTLDTLLVFIILYLLIIVSCAALNYASTYQGTAVEVGVDKDLRNDAFEHLQTLSFSYFNQNSVGYIHSRVMSDTSRIGTLVSWTLLDSIWQLSYLVGASAVMLSLNARLALLVLAVLPVTVLLFSFFQARLTKLNREIREQNSVITGAFNEGITGARTIKTLVIEELMGRSFTDETEKQRKMTIKAARMRGLFASTMHFASSLALAIVLWKGGIIAKTQIGTFSLFMSYAQGMMEPVRWIVDAVGGLITTQVNIERLCTLLDTKPEVQDRPEVLERYGDAFRPKRENWETLVGDIEFDDVTFRYPDGEETVLEHFSLKIPFGTCLAIVGETGAGKSTLANLICRFYEPTAGRVLIDGRDARDRSQLWLHSSIGYVLQTPQLFSGTIRDNLLYGNPEASPEQIDRALALVSARDFVDRLEQGLDTDVGEGGDLLSTGEKQLLCFARAILCDPRILILDEATASVDTITEQKIQDAIDTVIRGRTSVVIAHRLSTVRNADWILHMEDGRIVEQGTHEQLMAARGGYWRLYTRQYEDEITLDTLG